MADDLVPSPSEPQLRGNSREYLLSRLQRGGFTELLGAVDAGELTVYGVATAAGLVTRPTPSGRGSPNARKKRDWAVLKAYRKSARADAALVPETPHNGCSAPSPTACWACPAYGRLCAVLVLIRLLALATYWLLFSIRPLIFLTKRHLGSATFWRFRGSFRLSATRQDRDLAKEPLSLETPIGDEEDSHLGDFIEDKNAILPIDAAIQSNLRETTTRTLASLTPREE